MGYSTDFVGTIGIDPPLNSAEIAYLKAFSESRRMDRQGDPYAVPGNPCAENIAHMEGTDAIDTETYNTVAPGQPGYWCDWVPCLSGCCLTYNGNEKFYSADRWMLYLIDHFLRPGAAASRSESPWFQAFTFNHRCDGMIVGCRRDTQELFVVQVAGNQVSRRLLMEGDFSYESHPTLPYQEAIDQVQVNRWRHVRNPREVFP